MNQSNLGSALRTSPVLRVFRSLRVVSGLVALAVAAHAWAVEPFNVRDIRVEGLQRVEPGTVFASIPVRVGDRYDDEKGAAAIRSLFALGLFKDVRLEVQGEVLVVVTPDMHRVHHSIDPSETHSNFGFNLAIWDRMFGAYRAQPAAGHEGMTIGLPIFRDKAELRLDRLLSQPFRKAE